MKYLKLNFSFLLFIASAISLSSCDLVSDSDSKTTKVTASDVKDKASLKAFVLSAKEHLEKDYETAVQDFKTKEEWKKDSIYLSGITQEGFNLFHSIHPELEGTDLSKNPNLKSSALEKILEASKNGEGFIEYEWDNPAVEDDNYNSKKVAYLTNFKKDGIEYIVSAGIYITE